MKRVVFKVGSSVLTDTNNLVSLLAKTRKHYEAILVTSGVVAANYMMNHNKEMFLCSGYNLKTASEFLFSDDYEKGTLFSNKR